MDTVADARTKMCAFVQPLGAESVELGSAAGRTLAETICAPRDQPPFRSSAMDGYACARRISIGATSASSASRPPAKRTWARVGPGEAVRIFTGAPVPEGADCVVQQEKTRRDGAAAHRRERPRARRPTSGQSAVDFRAGAPLIAAGTRLSARHIALIASAGLASVPVSRRPRIAVLATGTELRAPGQTAGPDQIYDSVSFGLGAMIDNWGGQSAASRGEPR